VLNHGLKGGGGSKKRKKTPPELVWN